MPFTAHDGTFLTNRASMRKRRAVAPHNQEMDDDSDVEQVTSDRDADLVESTVSKRIKAHGKMRSEGHEEQTYENGVLRALVSHITLPRQFVWHCSNLWSAICSGSRELHESHASSCATARKQGMINE